jgi:hypothetical protein
MLLKQKITLFLSSVILFVPIYVNPGTIVVVSGKATVDGRPLLWKNRDVNEQNNLVRFYPGVEYSFIGISKAGDYSSVWSGINSAGFAIVNSVSYDLEGTGSTGNGQFMKTMLSRCGSVDEFEARINNQHLWKSHPG